MNDLQNVLERVVSALERSGVPFMIAGSFASAAHGLPRATQDLDIVIDPKDEGAVTALLDLFPEDAYYVDEEAALDAFRRRSMFNIVDQASGWKIDLIIRKNRPFSLSEFQRRLPLTLLTVPVRVASAEDTIVAKLEWSAQSGGSERQRRDVSGILATVGGTLDRDYISRWIDELGLRDEWEAAQKTASG
ncbi:MAG: hypothetical protein IT384_22470 [Deltaproteobacteria bacterium]|nr:hypothetical protein [Deltaproteobacteria bacterium]